MSTPDLYVLKFRPGKGSRWAALCEPTTHSACVALIGVGGRRAGCWWVNRIAVEPSGLVGLLAGSRPAEVEQGAEAEPANLFSGVT